MPNIVAELSALDVGAFVVIDDGRYRRTGVIIAITHDGKASRTNVKLAQYYWDQKTNERKNIGANRTAFLNSPTSNILGAMSDYSWRHPNAKNWNLDASIIDYIPPKW